MMSDPRRLRDEELSAYFQRLTRISDMDLIDALAGHIAALNEEATQQEAHYEELRAHHNTLNLERDTKVAALEAELISSSPICTEDLQAEIARLRAALLKYYAQHNQRGEDGPCDCEGCREYHATQATP